MPDPKAHQTTVAEACLVMSWTLLMFSIVVPFAFIVLGALHAI